MLCSHWLMSARQFGQWEPSVSRTWIVSTFMSHPVATVAAILTPGRPGTPRNRDSVWVEPLRAGEVERATSLVAARNQSCDFAA